MLFSPPPSQAALQTSPLKICFILPSLAAGGAERVMITLMNGLDRSRYAPQLIVIDGSGPYRSLIPPDIDFTDIKKSGVVSAIPRLISILRKDKPDIILSTMAHMNFVILSLRPFLAKTKIIVREAITPGYTLDGPARFKGLIAKCLWRLLYPSADLVLSPTKLVYEEFESRIGLHLHKKIILPNPVDVDYLRSKALEKENIFDPENLNFICVGRLHYQKGLDLLLKGLIEKPPPRPWHLLIVGEGPEHESLKETSAHPSLAGHVAFTGLQKNPWAYMASADYLLLPSRWEGLPNVVLESLAVGTPVIALSNAGGISEIATYTKPGDLYIAPDIAAFMEAVSRATKKNTKGICLPDIFYKKNVINAFSDICENFKG